MLHHDPGKTWVRIEIPTLNNRLNAQIFHCSFVCFFHQKPSCVEGHRSEVKRERVQYTDPGNHQQITGGCPKEQY